MLPRNFVSSAFNLVFLLCHPRTCSEDPLYEFASQHDVEASPNGSYPQGVG